MSCLRSDRIFSRSAFTRTADSLPPGTIGGRVTLWDVPSWVDRHLAWEPLGVTSMAFHPDGKSLTVGGGANRDVVARGRAPGIIGVEATQRPSADIIPTSLRDLFGYRWAFRCSTEASSDTILGHGWADKGYSATEIDPQARGVSWLRAEDGIPRRVKAAYLTDEQIIDLASFAATARTRADDDSGKVIRLPWREGDAA